jgi:hypothetical protein
MKRSFRLPLFALLVCLSQLPGLAAGEMPEVGWEGEFIRFATTVDHLPCGRSLDYMDRRAGQLMAELGQPASTEEKITYYWLPGRMDLSPCPENADCSDGEERIVYSRTMFHDHEMVHVVMRELGKRHTFIYEGLAEAFGRRGPILRMPPEKAREEIVRSLSANIDPATIDYPLAGVFSRYLIEEFGLTAYLRAYARADLDTDLESFESIFREELGTPLDEILDAFVEEVPQCYPRTNLCADDPNPWSGETWEADLGLSCEDGGVLEILPGILTNWTVIEVPLSGNYVIKTEGSSDFPAEVAIVPCECEPQVTLVGVGGEKTVSLEAGAHRIVFGLTVEDVANENRSVKVVVSAAEGEERH